MRIETRRDRLIGAAFLGAIWTALSMPIVCGFNPVGAFVHDSGALGVGVILLIAVLWMVLFYGALTVWARRRT
jgi:hypothetical protein